MITGIEIPYVFALLYPSFNVFWWDPKLRPEVQKEIEHIDEPIYGIEIKDCHTKTYQPIYLNIKGFPMLLPLGGGTATNYKYLLSRHISNDKKKEYHNYCQIEDQADISMSFTKEGYINSYLSLLKICKQYNIPEDSFKINLPLKVKYYHYKDGLYLHKHGFVASNKHKLIDEILWRKRLPLTVTIPTIAGISLLCCWLEYYTQKEYRYISLYYPPFHYERIIGYFQK